MSRVVFLASFAALATILACGAHSNNAVAEPKKGATSISSASSDQPLVPYALDADADVVRALREQFRTSFEKPEAMKPGEPTLVRFALPDTNHTFRTGHRIMVQVQSSWFPLADRNPQTFVDIAKATEADFKVATHRILYGGAQPSSVKVTLARGSL